MKTAKQWVDENSQSGPFDTVFSCQDAENLVKEIQTDAAATAETWETVNRYVIEPNSLAETLLEIAAKHGNKVSIDIVAAYAAHLTGQGRDDLMQAIAEGYSATRPMASKWTTGRPKESGYYWYRETDTEPELIEWDVEMQWVRRTGSEIALADGHSHEITGEFWPEKITGPPTAGWSACATTATP